LYQMLKDIHDVSTFYQLDYWIDRATLLGAIQYRGLSPWAEYLQICISEEQEKLFSSLLPVFGLMGYEVVQILSGFYKIYPTNGIPVEDRPWKYPGCDVFVIKKAHGTT